MTDIVKRLRDLDTATCEDAADEIERLRAEGDRARSRGDKLRMALEDIAYPNPLHNEDDLMRIARAVLEAKP